MPLEFLDELSNLVRQIIHRPLETGQEVERHHDWEPHGRYRRQNRLLHSCIHHQAVISASSTVRMNAFLSDVSVMPLIRKNSVSCTFVTKASSSAFVTSSRGRSRWRYAPAATPKGLPPRTYPHPRPRDSHARTSPWHTHPCRLPSVPNASLFCFYR